MRRAGEDYLEAIITIEHGQGEEGVRTTDIAESLSVSKASTTRAVQHLLSEGFVEKENYGSIYLTRKGRAAAEDVLFRHSTLVRFFSEVLEVSPEQAKTDAHKMEHDISPEALEKLLSYMQGEKGRGSMGPGLLEMVEQVVGQWLKKEKRAKRIKSWNLRFSDRYSPWTFSYERADGETVYAIMKFESFEKEKVDCKCKMINFVLSDPERNVELWYVRRNGNGRTISVSKTIRERILEINGVLSEADMKLSEQGASIGCYKISLRTDQLGLEDIMEF